ncbi:hypothetical protein HERIO_1534 [Hepatospora eriocheir]|uniref:Uncharacterized protein n=1 Tax=Hepatospora eriocheir TaxID=1081669 RepID=A0A1X0Q9S2_9MICR|nr:hypothetical protein HERIO_1534 [Hepatospora eriocheir]
MGMLKFICCILCGNELGESIPSCSSSNLPDNDLNDQFKESASISKPVENSKSSSYFFKEKLNKIRQNDKDSSYSRSNFFIKNQIEKAERISVCTHVKIMGDNREQIKKILEDFNNYFNLLNSINLKKSSIIDNLLNLLKLLKNGNIKKMKEFTGDIIFYKDEHDMSKNTQVYKLIKSSKGYIIDFQLLFPEEKEHVCNINLTPDSVKNIVNSLFDVSIVEFFNSHFNEYLNGNIYISTSLVKLVENE